MYLHLWDAARKIKKQKQSRRYRLCTSITPRSRSLRVPFPVVPLHGCYTFITHYALLCFPSRSFMQLY